VATHCMDSNIRIPEEAAAFLEVLVVHNQPTNCNEEDEDEADADADADAAADSYQSYNGEDKDKSYNGEDKDNEEVEGIQAATMTNPTMVKTKTTKKLKVSKQPPRQILQW
jgi:uncharacterized protein YpmB